MSTIGITAENTDPSLLSVPASITEGTTQVNKEIAKHWMSLAKEDKVCLEGLCSELMLRQTCCVGSLIYLFLFIFLF